MDGKLINYNLSKLSNTNKAKKRLWSIHKIHFQVRQRLSLSLLFGWLKKAFLMLPLRKC